jgi:cell division transport system permease protein
VTRLLTFSVAEAIGGLRRGWRSSGLALLTMAAAVFVAAAALLTSINVREILARLGAASELTVYLKADATPADRSRIAALLGNAPVVATYRLITPEEALRRFSTDVPDLAPLTSSLGENPFPAAFEVRLRSGPQTGASADEDPATHALVASLAKAGGVDDVRYDRQVIERLLGGLQIMERLGAALASVLVLAAVLTIASVLRLSYQTRQDEVGIMYLVGAPPRAIRGPFVAEGLLLACLGATLALIALGAAFVVVRAKYGTFVTDAFGLPALWFLPWTTIAGLLLTSAFVGGAAGLAASWRER